MNLKACLIIRDIGDLKVRVNVIGGINVVQHRQLRIDLPTSASQKKKTRSEVEVGCFGPGIVPMHFIYSPETLAPRSCHVSGSRYDQNDPLAISTRCSATMSSLQSR
jgi:hypothetical protein